MVNPIPSKANFSSFPFPMGCHVVASFMASLSSRKHCGHHHANKAHLRTFGGIDCLVSFRFDDPTRTEKTQQQVVPRISEFVLLWLFVAFGFLTHQYLGLKFGMFFKEAQKLLCTKNDGAAWCSNMFFKHFPTDHVQTDHPSIANIPAFLVGS